MRSPVQTLSDLRRDLSETLSDLERAKAAGLRDKAEELQKDAEMYEREIAACR
jgi:hypothetical protein